MTFDASPARTLDASFVPHSTPFSVASAEGASSSPRMGAGSSMLPWRHRGQHWGTGDAK